MLDYLDAQENIQLADSMPQFVSPDGSCKT
ncbi:MAG: hypothetical protein FMNOHCHN_03372 [Ignavibacteriaceae bacterium]|nr:hypothetical protein [Ignavibacteriaceae bacterium]